MEFEIIEKETYTLINVSGALDLYNVNKLKKEFQNIIEDGRSRSVVMGLEKLEYMDSSGIALMAWMRKRVIKMECKFYLMNVSAGVLQVMQLAALESFFTFIQSEEEVET